MNTKIDKAMEYLESLKFREGIFEEKADIYKLCDVQGLLIQLKKYKAMWEELYNNTSDYDRGTDILYNMDDLKLKYFPKPSKDFTKKVMEKIEKGGNK